MAKKKQQEVSGSYDFTPQIETEDIIIREVVKPHVDNSIIMKVENLRAKGFDNNRIAATLMIHKHIVESI